MVWVLFKRKRCLPCFISDLNYENAVYLTSKRTVRVVFAAMAESLEGSFSVKTFELIVLKNAATIQNVDNITTYSFRGYCLRGKGRSFCLCKNVNSFCSSECCRNNWRLPESDSEDTVNLSKNSLCCLIFGVVLYIFQTSMVIIRKLLYILREDIYSIFSSYLFYLGFWFFLARKWQWGWRSWKRGKKSW